MPTCLLGLGANLGKKRQTLETAVAQLSTRLEVLGVSNWRGYVAVGGPQDQDDFLNGAVLCKTDQSPDQVAGILKDVEQNAGRQRHERWSARTLDCDLLLYGADEIRQPQLIVPHPRMVTRRFVLEPAAEVAPDMIHPGSNRTIQQLLNHLNDSLPYFAVLGSSADVTREVAQHIAQQLSGELLPRHVPQCTSSAGADEQQVLKVAQSRSRMLAESSWLQVARTASSAPLISDFWYWQPLIGEDSNSQSRLRTALQAWHPAVEAKLLMITDSADSPFGRALSDVCPTLRPPTLFLSQTRPEALQDAVGAVLSMR